MDFKFKQMALALDREADTVNWHLDFNEKNISVYADYDSECLRINGTDEIVVIKLIHIPANCFSKYSSDEVWACTESENLVELNYLDD